MLFIVFYVGSFDGVGVGIKIGKVVIVIEVGFCIGDEYIVFIKCY